MKVGKRGKIEPVDLLLDLIIFIEYTADAADPPISGRAQAQLLALVRVALLIMPGQTRREEFRGRRMAPLGTGALIVVDVGPAGVLRVVLNLIDVAHEIGPRIKQLQ